MDGPDFERFLTLLRDHPQFWAKVTCPDRLTRSSPPAYDDVVPFARTVVEEFPDRVLWGTDWPHPNLKSHMPDDGALVDFIPRIAPTEPLRRQLLVDNPAHGRMIGYLIGVPKIDESWGRSVWVELAGHAINHPSNAELYRDLYAALSPSWVALGCLAHYALIPSWDQAALEAWFNLSFGKEHVHAIRETAPASTFDAPIDPTLEIRRAGPARP